MPEKFTVKIRFPELDSGGAGRAAMNLLDVIRDATPDVTAKLQKDDTTTQDIGTALVAVFGTPAIVLIARGIANWISRTRQTIVIERDGEKVTFKATGRVDENAVRIAEALVRK